MIHRAAITLVLVVLGAGRANGQTAAAGDLATADTLFAEAKRLSAEQRFAEACARFEASLALSPRLGVALNLADCYEQLGRTASAWVSFGEAAALARRLADPREKFALTRQQALVPRLSRLRITLSTAPVEGLVVVRDGARVEPVAFGVEVPVDPGPHAVIATAPGRRPWSAEVAVSGAGDVATIEVPELERAPAPRIVPMSAPPEAADPFAGGAAAAAPSPTPDAARVGSGRHRITPLVWTSLGVAAGGFGAGIAFGVAARSLWQEARPGCEQSNFCSDAAYEVAQRSRRDANLSTASFAVGVAALAVGAILFARTLRGQDRAVQVVPDFRSSMAGATLVGAF